MKQVKKIILLICCSIAVVASHAQTPLQKASLRNMRGVIAPFSDITKKDSLILICFWSSNSDESINELNAINVKYEAWKEQTHFRMMAVCIDTGKLANRVRPTVNMNGWTFDVFVDIRAELRKAVNANNLPEAMIIKGGKVTYQQSGFEAGSENYLIQKLQLLVH
jgi:cytochrome c biogenesis protein CcmG/thiol:disulfide interchange protein DsbE